MSSALAITPSLFETIQSQALTLGFDHIAVTEPHISEKDQQAYSSWVQAGLPFGLEYMGRNVENRIHPANRYPGLQSVMTVGVSYYQGPFPEKPGAAFGKVARYAWGLDYHEVIYNRLQELLKLINELLDGGGHAILAVDTKPILERAIASSAGMGFVGKNTVFIIPRSSKGFHVGSYVFLGEILLDLPLEGLGVPPSETTGCGGCTRCLTACPTDAFEKPYRLLAERCIAYLTIENKGWISREMRPLIGDWLFGCDVCQDVCPFNARVYETRWPEFKADQGVGAWVSLQEIFSLSDDHLFKEKFKNTPFSRPKRKGLLRNACVVAGNSQDESLIPNLKILLEDVEPVVRGHALWALSRLMNDPAARELASKQLAVEQDEAVRRECRDVLDP